MNLLKEKVKTVQDKLNQSKKANKMKIILIKIPKKLLMKKSQTKFKYKKNPVEAQANQKDLQLLEAMLISTGIGFGPLEQDILY